MRIHLSCIQQLLFVFASIASVTSTSATAAIPTLPMAPSATATGDLEFDSSFGIGGSTIIAFDAAPNLHDEGLRVFYRCTLFISGTCIQSRYYAVGKHNHGATWDAAIAQLDDDGTLVSKVTVPTSMTRIDDVVLDPDTGRLYFIGAQTVFLLPDLQFTVFCMDVDTGAPCSGFAANGNVAGYRFHLFDLGGNNNDVGTRAVLGSAGFLTVGGWAQEANGYQLAVWKLNATTGENAPSFGTDGGVHYAVGGAVTGRDHNVYGMALTSVDAPGGQLLYLVGDYVTSTGDYDGLVLSLESDTGAMHDVVRLAYEEDNAIYASDAVMAVTVLANGDLVVIGFSNTNVADYPSIFLAKLLSAPIDLNYDPDFCGGGLCVYPVGGDYYQLANALPTAIAERPGNRDLVFSMQAKTLGEADQNQKHIVWEVGASGNVRHAAREISFKGSNQVATTTLSAGMLVTDSEVTLIGSRVFNAATDDLDFTVTRLLDNDSIFASQFGGPASD